MSEGYGDFQTDDSHQNNLCPPALSIHPEGAVSAAGTACFLAGVLLISPPYLEPQAALWCCPLLPHSCALFPLGLPSIMPTDSKQNIPFSLLQLPPARAFGSGEWWVLVEAHLVMEQSIPRSAAPAWSK